MFLISAAILFYRDILYAVSSVDNKGTLRTFHVGSAGLQELLPDRQTAQSAEDSGLSTGISGVRTVSIRQCAYIFNRVQVESESLFAAKGHKALSYWALDLWSISQ